MNADVLKQNKKAIIIGANGYIGRNMAAVIKKNTNWHLDLVGRQETQADGLENYISADLLIREQVEKIDFNCEIVYMLSGKSGSVDGFNNPISYIDSNEKILLNVLDEMKKQKSKAKLIFPSTRLVYEGKKGKLLEYDSKEYKSIYAINKMSCEKFIELYHEMFGINYVIFRICLPYGTIVEDARSYGTINYMINRAQKGQNIILYGNGEARRTLTHIEDLCNVLIFGSACTECDNDTFNIGGEDYSLREIAQPIADKHDVSVDYVKWPELALKSETGDTVFDDSRLIRRIGYVYRHSFSEWVGL